MKDNRNILHNCYVSVSIDKKGNVKNKKFVEFSNDEEAINYVTNKNQYKTREESSELYLIYKIKKTEIL